MKKKMPIGFRPASGDHRPRVAVVFDEELFDKIRAMAALENKSFSEMVRELCRVGILDLEESDRLEPSSSHLTFAEIN